MDVKAKAKYIRIAPRKARLVADVVRGLALEEAFNKLALLNKKASAPIVKLLESALANAQHNNNAKKEDLYVKHIAINDGPIFYRWMPRAFGRATKLRKRTSVMDVVLAERVTVKEKKTETKEVKVEKTTKPTKSVEKTELKTKKNISTDKK